ncbi:MAG TPA: Tm-1-like ATP-binding domain-containing protein [Candidatus Ruania gallistercoris]|uniref:Tm-1-like ATP-binding domain-containing protein n=1 Tax=Candidatus Ruania gallistercoris TaxID=2838746 RepID=A0A9D2EGB1_9MICO|nr:Tm-1-like ATP-binding domain-containing protein [Candidatus Ruania gallistercoris]
MPTPTVAVLATLDTKQAEADYLAAQIRAAGATARVLDIGLGSADQEAEVTNTAVAARASTTVEELRQSLRHEAMAAMGQGAGEILRQWYDAGRLHGAIAVGGNQGTAIASIAMRHLPIGPAKLIVSTVASGNVREYVLDSDITMQFSVADLLGGPNVVTRDILRRSAAGVVAMAQAATAPPEPEERTVVAITAFGNTEPAVVTAMAHLAEAGCACVPFHASGACGSAMERLIGEGTIDAVLDLTTHELLGEIEPRDIYAPVRPGRLTAAGRRGAPQVVVPGGLEYFCFGGAQTIPPEYRDRPTHIHNPYNTNVRTSAEELHQVGELLAARLNDASGPVAVLIPTRGWSGVGSPGGVLHSPETNQAFIDTLHEQLAGHIRFELHDLAINDVAFAERAARTLIDLLPAPR